MIQIWSKLRLARHSLEGILVDSILAYTKEIKEREN
jgi:hypothetical protein